MMRIRLALLGLFILLLAACSSIDHGQVISKTYHPAYTYVTFITTYCGTGCFISVPQIIDVPECYGVWLRNVADEGEVCLDPITYNNLHPGMSYEQS